MNLLLAMLIAGMFMTSNVEAETYSKDLLRGAGAIVNEAKLSPVTEDVKSLRQRLEEYMRNQNVKFPATFPVEGGEVTLIRFDEDKTNDGRGMLVMILSKSTDPTPRRVILYTEVGLEPT